MNRVKLFGAIAALVCASSTARAQVTIYSDDFSGGGADLNGQAPDVDAYLGGGNAWIGIIGILDNGSITSGHGSMVLPFEPQFGTIYEISATVTNVNSPDTVGDWVALGFSQSATTTTANTSRFSNSPTNGYAWILTRNLSSGTDQEMFAGPRTTGPFTGVSGDIVDPTQPVDMRIVLNTTSLTWTAEYFLNGVSRGSQDLPASAKTDIAFAGFSRSKSSTTNIPTIDDFLLVRTGPAIIPGDVNANEVVDMDDFTPILNNFFNSVTMRAEGDLTGDGLVDFLDFREWKDAFTGDSSAADAAIAALGVPEPSTVVLLGMGAAVALVAARLSRKKTSR